MQNPETLSPEEFARAVAEMGAAGKTQPEIAESFGLTKDQVRWRLLNTGYTWTSEVRVKLARTGEDLLAPHEAAAA